MSVRSNPVIFYPPLQRAVRYIIHDYEIDENIYRLCEKLVDFRMFKLFPSSRLM